MSDLALYGHPFSSYTWKALIALWEKRLAFIFRSVDPAEPQNGADLARLWPVAKFPLLVEGERVLPETSAIIERLDQIAPEPRLIPSDPDAAIEVRLLDRVFDNHVMSPMQAVVSDALRPAERRDPIGVADAKAKLVTIYGWLDQRLAGREWAAGDAFTLADCAGAPSLFYADWVQPIGDGFPTLRAYRRRVLARPSVARAVDEARPYRGYFPLGAPDRD